MEPTWIAPEWPLMGFIDPIYQKIPDGYPQSHHHRQPRIRNPLPNRKAMPANDCAGHRTDGEPCGGQRKKGSKYCRLHIGGTIARARAEVRAHVLTMGFGDYDVDVDEIALKLVALGVNRVTQLTDELESMVAQVGLEAAMVGETTVIDSEGGTHAGREYIRGLADAEFRERKLLIDLVFKAKAANLGERELRLAEKTGLVMATVLKAFLSDPDLQLTPSQRAAFPAIARRHLGLDTGPLPVTASITIDGSTGP